MTEYIKVCKVHGSLDKTEVYKNNVCKKCQYEWQLKYEQKDKERWIKYRINKRSEKRLEESNITLESFNELLKQQNNVCAICKNNESTADKRRNKVRRLSIDHCHKTQKIRGLLCGKCNQALGLFNDSIIALENAIKYLTD